MKQSFEEGGVPKPELGNKLRRGGKHVVGKAILQE